MTWLLLLIVALFTVLFPLLDIVGTARGGLPSDHTAACQALAGHSFPGIQPTGPTRYIRQLEYGYALHELAFALFFLVIVAIPVPGRAAMGVARVLADPDPHHRIHPHLRPLQQQDPGQPQAPAHPRHRRRPLRPTAPVRHPRAGR